MVTSYIQALRTFHHDVLLYLLTTALIGFTIDGGIYSVVFNLYLLRLGYGPELVGQVNSAGMLIFALGSLPAGALGARFGNRRVLIVGLTIILAGCTLLPLAEFVPAPWPIRALFAAYIIVNTGMALFFVNGAPYLMGITQVGERNHVFSVQSAIWSFAAFAGSLLAGFLPSSFALLFNHSLAEPAPYRYPLFLVAITLIPAFWAALSTRREAGSSPLPGLVDPTKVEGITWAILAIILMMSLVRLLQVAGAGVVMTFFNVYMDAGLHIATPQIGLVVACGRLLAVLAALMTPILATRWGNAQLAIWASFGVALFLLPLAYASHWGMAGLGYIGVIALTSIRYPSFLIYIMGLMPARYRSVMSGAGEMAAGFSFSLMALAGGYLIANQGYRDLFLLGAASTVLGTLILWGFLRARGREVGEERGRQG